MSPDGDPPLGEPWAGDLRRADAAIVRFDRAVATVAAGPLRDRLAALRPSIEQAVGRCAAVAAEGQKVSLTLAELGPDRVTAELKDARRLASSASPGSPLAEAATARVAAAEAQHRVVHRMWDAVDAARARLGADLARLDELVARTLELAVLPDGGGQAAVDGGRGGLDDVVDDLEGLRRAFEELQGPGGGGGPAT